MYTNARFQWIGTLDFGRKFAQYYMSDKIFEKKQTLSNKHVVIYPYTKF